MDKFTPIYKMLTALERGLDAASFDLAQIRPEVLEITQARWGRYLEMLSDRGYIKGVSVRQTIQFDAYGPRITLKGLEYLYSNPLMKECRAAAQKR